MAEQSMTDLGTSALLIAAAAVVVATAGCDPVAPSLAELRPPQHPLGIEAPVQQVSPGRPNLILISIDTLRADRLSTYGHDRPTSPHIDRFAAESVLFENGFSHSPKTAPSHMSLMTSLYPESHRVTNRLEGAKPGTLSVEIPTLAEILSAAGYDTYADTGGGNLQGDIGFARGFATYSAPLWSDSLAAATARLGTLGDSKRPFFLFAHTYQTHSPYLPPERYRDGFVAETYAGKITTDFRTLAEGKLAGHPNLHRSFWRRVDRKSEEDRRHLLDLYDACIRFADEQVGTLLDRIDELGLRKNTLVVLTSDHGEQFGEHEGFEHGALWQELLHVPLIIRVPQEVRPGWHSKRIAASVGLIDVLPTLLELMGIAQLAHFQGRSLVPVVEAGADGRPWTFAQYRSRNQSSLRAGTWKLLRQGTKQQLFDLASDPRELHDETSSHPEMLNRGAEQIDRIIQASRAYWTLAREGETAELDIEQRRQLEALGYGGDG